MRGPSRLPLTTEGHDRQPLNSMSVYSYSRKLYWGLCFHSLLQSSSTDVGTSPRICRPNNTWVSRSTTKRFILSIIGPPMLQTQVRAFWMEASSCERFPNPFMNWRVDALVIGPALIRPVGFLLIYRRHPKGKWKQLHKILSWLAERVGIEPTRRLRPGCLVDSSLNRLGTSPFSIYIISEIRGKVKYLFLFGDTSETWTQHYRLERPISWPIRRWCQKETLTPPGGLIRSLIPWLFG